MAASLKKKRPRHSKRRGPFSPSATTYWACFLSSARSASLRDLPGGKLEVVFCYPRSSKVVAMTFRNDADLAELKRQAQ